MGVPATEVLKVGEGRPDVVDLIAQGGVSLVVNTPSAGARRRKPPVPQLPAGAERRGMPLALGNRRTVGYRIRAAALQYHASYITTLVALRAAVAGVRALRAGRLSVMALDEVTRMSDVSWRNDG
jgi:carbamoyl-phosphate synthase large subunit